jgi:hypothetical protein
LGLGVVFVPGHPAKAVTTIVQLGADIDGEAILDYSGRSVAMSADGTRIAIGAPLNRDGGNTAGHVRVYSWNGSAWTQTGADIDGEAADDNSGYAVAMSANGTRIAIGAQYNDGNGSNSGHVRIYSWNGSAWTQTGADIDGEAAGDESGASVAMSSDGSRVAIAAPLNDGNGNNSGHVRIYSWNGSAWTQTGADINGEAADDQSGSSSLPGAAAVAMSSDGTRIAIGARLHDNNGSNSGHVRIFTWNGSAWTQTGADIDGEAAGDESGSSVAMSSDGTRIAIGAQFNDGTASNAGHVRTYTWNSGSWTQTGADIDGEAADDQSGSSVAMSSDGTRIAVGAFGNDGTATNAGQVRIYTWNSGSWTQTGADIDGEATYDYSGYSVAMRANGSRVAIGAWGNRTYTGQVRVYDVLTNPAAPTISSVTAASGSATVSFSAGNDGGSVITNYKYSIDGTNFVALNPAATTSPITISGLTNGTTYSFTIKAVNGLGDSTASNSVAGTPTAPTTTIAPTTTTTTTTTTVAQTTTVPAAITKTASIKTGTTSLLSKLVTASNISVPNGTSVAGSVSSNSSSVCRTAGSKISGVAPGKCVVKVRLTPKKGSSTTASISINVVGSPAMKRGAAITLVNSAAAAGLSTGSGLSVEASVASSSEKLCKVSGTKIVGTKVGTCSVTLTVTSSSGATSSATLRIRIQ